MQHYDIKEIFKKRPYPKWGHEFEIGRSNDGEDDLIIDYFKNNLESKYLVDIGAADGVTGTNSYRLITEFGWSATLVEPLKQFYDYLLILHEKNKNVEILNYACDDEEKEKILTYRNFDEGIGLTSLCHKWENNQNVQTKRFNDIIINTKINFLSIDAEGKDLSILKDINFNKYDIDFICCERDPNDRDKNMINYLFSKNYNLLSVTNHNFIFIKKTI